MQKKEKNTSFGLNKKSEKLNGQIAMIAFIVIILIEFFTEKAILIYFAN
jgi:hypothetical protein